MIFDALLGLIVGFFTFVLNLLPDWSDPSFVTPGDNAARCPVGLMCTIGDYVGELGEWIDVYALRVSLEVCIAVLIAAAATKLALFVYEHIPGKAS